MPVKVSREAGGHEDFTLPETESLGSDVAMVGGDESTDIRITPDDGKVPPNLPSESEDWDLTPEQKRQQIRRPRGDEDERLGQEEHDLLDDQQRLSRRQRRNMRRREAMAGANQEIVGLQQQVGVLTELVGRLTQGQQGIATHTLDSNISSLEQARKMASAEIAAAMATNDPAKLQEVMDLRDQIGERLQALKLQRERVAAAPDPRQMDFRQEQPRVDPRIAQAVQDHFEDFRDDYPWFDPTSADANCNIVRAVDTELTNQGYQRHTPVFWDQMRKRMGDYGLKPEDDVEEDRGMDRRRVNGGGSRQVLGRERSLPPTSAGRGTRPNGAGAFTLSDVQKQMLQEEGLLEAKLSDEDVAKRDRIISSWRKGARALRNVN